MTSIRPAIHLYGQRPFLHVDLPASAIVVGVEVNKPYSRVRHYKRIFALEGSARIIRINHLPTP